MALQFLQPRQKRRHNQQMKRHVRIHQQNAISLRNIVTPIPMWLTVVKRLAENAVSYYVDNTISIKDVLRCKNKLLIALQFLQPRQKRRHNQQMKRHVRIHQQNAISLRNIVTPIPMWLTVVKRLAENAVSFLHLQYYLVGRFFTL